MWTRSDCLRRVALAETCAANVDLEVARDRLLGFARMWRERADEVSDEPERVAA